MTDWQEIAEQLREKNIALREQIADLELRAHPEEDVLPYISRLQGRISRQRKVLDRLNRKVLSQRFRLNLLKELGRDVTYEEYMAARGENERIDEYATL